MTPKNFILILLAIFVGVLAALAVAGLFVKAQVQNSAASNPLLNAIGL